MNYIGNFIKSHRKEVLFVFFLLILFLFIRLPGLSQPLHQDEYKWPRIVNPATNEGVNIPHPPLGEAIYREAGKVVGYDVHFREVPLFFGALNLLLLYYFVRITYGRREALIASLIFTFSFYSILASLMVDTDGEIMPFFFLLSLVAYRKFTTLPGGRQRNMYLGLLVLSSVAGFLVKVSFLLGAAAIFADYVFENRKKINGRIFFRYFLILFVSVAALVAILLLSSKFFSFFDLNKSLSYWQHFASTKRDWLQTFIQCVKATLYASPILMLVSLLEVKEVFRRARVFVFYLTFSFLFYVVIFDFSGGALDRYWQLIVLPLSVMSAIVISDILYWGKEAKNFLAAGFGLGLSLFVLQFTSHFVPALHPKSEWLARIFHLKWNFLYPFSGGSGPLGFYISFLFMALIWAFSVLIVLLALYKNEYKKAALYFLLPLGLIYNLVFAEEYLFGLINGSAPKLLNEAVAYIKDNQDIKMVTVYNDNGGDEIRNLGKYRKRLYTDPKFDQNEKVASLNKYKEHYYILDIPRVDPNSFYQKYFDSCQVIYKKMDRAISSTILDCSRAPDISPR